jgi:arylsulfatase A-like enzyme
MNTSRKHPNVIIIVIDAGRPDYLGCYGYPLETTPNINALAQEAILFENALSTAPWTLPSHGSLFTGLYPHQHGATWQTLRLNQGIPTIFEIFLEKSYDSIAISANTLIVSPYNMFGRGTKVLGEIPNNQPDLTSFSGNFDYRKTCSQRIADYFIEYLEGGSLHMPFIAYINFYDLHAKYKSREPFYSRFVTQENSRLLEKLGDYYDLHFREMNDEIDVSEELIAALRALYAAKLAMIDADLGRVLRKLKERGILDDSILILTSDHGDILGDHRKPSFHHQFSIHNSLLKIPLIFYKKGMGCTRINTPLIQNIDILPTVLELCHIDKSLHLDNLAGTSLVKYITGDTLVLPRQYAISTYEGPSRFILRNRRRVNPLYLKSLKAIQDEDYKLILSDKGSPELYHIKIDKNEKNNIAIRFPHLVSRLKGAFSEIKQKYGQFSEANIHVIDNEQELLSRLKALGYIQ